MKKFKIKRFSFLTDAEDKCITDKEIEAYLNNMENEKYRGNARWTVKEVKK